MSNGPLLSHRDSQGFPCDGSVGTESACNVGDTRDVGLISGLGRSPGGGNGNPFQYSCLKNHMDRGAWRAVSPKGHKESDTRLSDQVHPSGGKRDLNSH